MLSPASRNCEGREFVFIGRVDSQMASGGVLGANTAGFAGKKAVFVAVLALKTLLWALWMSTRQSPYGAWLFYHQEDRCFLYHSCQVLLYSLYLHIWFSIHDQMELLFVCQWKSFG